ncbi:MAG TPA: hypothetical protein DCM05_16445 [Elusimicrobia bacterium]|nr:hypothetical protein [Elusimicrobiota bacterium]
MVGSRRAWLPAAVLLLVYGCLSAVENPDLFWHLSAGDRLLSGAFPRSDFLSWPLAGAPWIDFEWLAQAVYAALFSLLGWWGLIALKTALFGGAAAFLLAALRLQGQGPEFEAAALGVAAAAWGISNDVRPDNFSLLLFSAELYALERIRLGDPAARRACLAAGFAAGALWANLHGAFAYGLALAALYAAGLAFEGGRRDRAAAVLAALAGGLAGTLLNPYGWRIYAVLLDHARHSALIGRELFEWQPAALGNSYCRPFWLLLCASMGALAAVVRQDRVLPLLPALLLGVWAFAAWRHMRNIPFFALAALPLAADLLGRMRRPALPPAWKRGLAAGVLAAAALHLRYGAPRALLASGFNVGRFPVEAAAYLEEHREPLARLRLYNPWGWGGYLGWRLSPDYRVFMDGRYLFHPMLAEENEATLDPGRWEAFVSRRGVELALLKRKQPDIRLDRRLPEGRVVSEPRPYYLFFMPQDRWALVYWDRLALLFVRRTHALRPWLKEREYRYLHPGDASALRRALEAGRIPAKEFSAEIRRHLRESGPDEEAAAFLAEQPRP